MVFFSDSVVPTDQDPNRIYRGSIRRGIAGARAALEYAHLALSAAIVEGKGYESISSWVKLGEAYR